MSLDLVSFNSIKLLTENSGTLAEGRERDDLALLDGVTSPAEEEAEYHSSEPGQRGEKSALGQLEAQRLRQIQHHRVLVEEQQKEVAKVADHQREKRHRAEDLPQWGLLQRGLLRAHRTGLRPLINVFKLYS